jgi:hypothetical protein
MRTKLSILFWIIQNRPQILKKLKGTMDILIPIPKLKT